MLVMGQTYGLHVGGLIKGITWACYGTDSQSRWAHNRDPHRPVLTVWVGMNLIIGTSLKVQVNGLLLLGRVSKPRWAHYQYMSLVPVPFKLAE